MSKLLEQTLVEVAKLPVDEQDAAAFVLIDYLAHRDDMQLTNEQRDEVSRRIADPDRVLVPYEQARAYLLRPRP